MNEKCFAMRPERICGLMEKKPTCMGYERCPFYKPKWMADRDNNRRLYRISCLSPEKQQAIADKYYDGDMPWKKVVL